MKMLFIYSIGYIIINFSVHFVRSKRFIKVCYNNLVKAQGMEHGHFMKPSG